MGDDKYNHCVAKLFGMINRQKRYAVTLGQTTYYSVSEQEVLKYPKWILHENRHKMQYRAEGTFKFLMKYLWYSIRYGYEDNPYEKDARNAEHNEPNY